MRGEDANVRKRDERTHDDATRELTEREIRNRQLATRIADDEERADDADEKRNRAARPDDAGDSADKRNEHVHKTQREDGARVGVVVDENGIGWIVGVLDRVRAGTVIGPVVQGIDRGLRKNRDGEQQTPDDRRKHVTTSNGIDAAEDRREHRGAGPRVRSRQAHGHERCERFVARRLCGSCHRLHRVSTRW